MPQLKLLFPYIYINRVIRVFKKSQLLNLPLPIIPCTSLDLRSFLTLQPLPRYTSTTGVKTKSDSKTRKGYRCWTGHFDGCLSTSGIRLQNHPCSCHCLANTFKAFAVNINFQYLKLRKIISPGPLCLGY